MKIKFDNAKEVFSVVLAGDICPGGNGGKVCNPDYASVLAPVRDFITSGDLKLVQWETPTASKLDPIIKSGPNLNSEEPSIEILTAGGFNIAMLANNHIGDQGPAAVLETIDALHKRGLKTVGAGRDLEAARAPLVETVKGKTVAVFNFAENEFGGADTDKPGSARQDPLRDVAEVRAAAKQYDFVIVTLHGGHETDPFPSPRMVQYCRAFADAGAKLVFNCHTHCPEGYENWNGTPIIYCPGNFYFPKEGRFEGLWRYGYMVRCLFGETAAAELELMPYFFNNDQVLPLDAAGNARFEAYMKRLCAPLDDPAKLRQLFEAWATRAGKSFFGAISCCLPPGSGWVAQIHEPVIRRMAMPPRNLFTCESHCDLLKCWFRLVEEQRIDEAARGLAEIDELQKGFMTPPQA